MSNRNLAPFPYFGGKYRLLPNLTPYIPRTIDLYLEPFFGSGTLFFSAPTWAETEIINDLNTDIYNFFCVLRNNYPKLKHLIKYTPYDIQTFNHAKEIIKSRQDLNRVTRAWALFVLMQMSIMANRRSFGRGSNGTKSHAKEFKNDINILDYCAERLKDATIENEDAIKVCKRYDGARAFIYLDPPYLNVRNKSSMHAAYHQTVPDDKMHNELLEWARSSKGYVLISNYHNPLYDEALKDWHVEEVEIKTIALSGKRGAKQSVSNSIEVLWSNDKCYLSKIRQPSLFGF